MDQACGEDNQQVVQLAPGGINAAARELGIESTEAKRAMKKIESRAFFASAVLTRAKLPAV